MLGDLNGDTGTGKSLLLALFAKLREGKMKIYANFHLKVNGAQLIDVQDLETIDSGLLLIDEAYIWLESRNSSSKINQYMSRIIFQSRKRRLDMFAAEQVRSSIDLRYRDLSKLTILALGKNTKGDFEYVYERNFRTDRFTIPRKTAEKIYPLYDTYEFPQMAITEYEPNRLNNVINKRIRELKKKYGDKITKLSKNMIKDYLVEKKQFEMGIHEPIYARIKREALDKA